MTEPIRLRCPECADGALEEKINRNSGHRFLACDNFVAKPSDSYPQGIGCQHTQEIPEYVRLVRAGAEQLPGFG